MKTLLTAIIVISTFISTQAQVTQINSNQSLEVTFPLNSTKTILVSKLDSLLWVTDATLVGTVRISNTIKFEESAGLLSGKLLFRGTTAATGSEMYITDGTPAGTTLVKDIYFGFESSAPADFLLLSGFVYFSAVTLAEGRELWKTNGTNVGTTLVTDIVTGPTGSNTENGYKLFTNGTYLLFAANTAAEGLELWKSDGTSAGTILLKNINTGADSSNPKDFYTLNANSILFTAKDATHGEELWKTDGTASGTVLVKDINNGLPGSISVELFPGFAFPIFQGFHTFNNKAYFRAFDGTSTAALWSTDGTAAGTVLVKDIIPGSSFPPPFIFVNNAVNLTGKFMFGVSDGSATSELWQCDGTPAGTSLFKSFSFINNDFPILLVNYQYDVNTGTLTTPLFQGNKFFFSASNNGEGRELWVSDGTLPNTKIVKDIWSGSSNGIDFPSYAFSTDTLYFSANDGLKGNELWKTDGTALGTVLKADINVGAGNSDPQLDFFIGNINGKLIFSANNGDNVATDLYVLGGSGVIPQSSTPCIGSNFSITSNIAGATYQWQVNTGSGVFSNLSNNATYTGTTTATLQINNVPSTLLGYQYRCTAGGNFSTITTIKFVNTWKGTINNLWNNPANWSCNRVPDDHMEVIINSGTPILNVNGICISITISTGANLTVNTGFSLKVAPHSH